MANKHLRELRLALRDYEEAREVEERLETIEQKLGTA